MREISINTWEYLEKNKQNWRNLRDTGVKMRKETGVRRDNRSWFSTYILAKQKNIAHMTPGG